MAMHDYMGKVCPYCKSEFVPGDDIVVCSACDMPHHRDCWVENQGCTTFGCQGTIKSIDGAATSVTATQIVYDDAPPAIIYCTQCGAPSPSNMTFCSKCGSRLAMPRQTYTPPVQQTYTPPVQQTYTPQPQTPAYFDMNTYQNSQQAYQQPVELDQDLVELVGPKSEYYLPAFQKLKRENKKTSWNWPAFLFAPYWMMYRKMYTYGAAALAGFFVLSLISSTLGTVLSLAAYVAFGVLGNYLYMTHLEKQAQQAKMISPQYKQEFMTKNGGVSTTAAALTVVGYAIFLFLVMG